MKHNKPISTRKKDTVDKVIQELETLSERVAPCFQCTTCASACPVFQCDASKNPRRIVYQLAQKQWNGILDKGDFWWCVGCYSCESCCPQGVPLTKILFHLKNMAFRFNKTIPKQIKRRGETLKTGVLLPITEEMIKKRDRLHLPEMIKPDLYEIQSIFEATGFLFMSGKSKSDDHDDKT